MLAGARPCSALDPDKRIRDYVYRTWNARDGLPVNSAQVILQTRDGYLWVGTFDGLARFDGTRFTVFNSANTPAMRFNFVQRLFEDDEGNLWIGTWDLGARGDLIRYRDGQFYRYGEKEGWLNSPASPASFQAAPGVVWAFEYSVDAIGEYRSGKLRIVRLNHPIRTTVRDHHGDVWATTDDGLIRFPAGDVDRAEPVETTKGLSLFYVVEASNGDIWASGNQGLIRLKAGDLSHLEHYLPRDTINSIFADRQGRIWAQTDEQGLVSILEGGVYRYGKKEGWPNSKIWRFLEDRDGSLWFATWGGLCRLRSSGDSRLECATTKDGLPDARIRNLYEDREGSIWATSESAGIYQFKESSIRTVAAADGIRGEVDALYQDRPDCLWIGTVTGLQSLCGGRLRRYLIPNAPDRNMVQSMARDERGSLLVATMNGVNQLDPETGRYRKLQVFGRSGGFARAPSLALHALYRDRTGKIWIGTDQQGIFRLVSGRAQSFAKESGTEDTTVRMIMEDDVGVVWFATAAGIVRYKDNRFDQLALPGGPGAAGEGATWIYEDANHVFWIGTFGGGLLRYEDGRFTRFTQQDGLPGDRIITILEDDFGYLWMSSTAGIFQVRKRDLEEFARNRTSFVEARSFGLADGMSNPECDGFAQNEAVKTTTGQLLFACNGGVMEVDPAKIAANHLPPPVMIESALADGKYLPVKARAQLPPRVRSLRIDYAGLSFVVPEQVRFHVKLEGFDRDWGDAGARREAVYTNLPPRRYRFRVMACNNAGVWNEIGAAWDFEVLPAFYQTYWFLALLVVAGASLLGTLYQRRLRLATQIIRARYDERLGERTRIARDLHDTLLQSLAGASLQLNAIAKTVAEAPELAQEKLRNIRLQIDASFRDARRKVWDLRSAALEGRDLPASLRESLNMIAQGMDGFRLTVIGEHRPFPPHVEEQVLRIAQECVANAARHAAASSIVVALRYGEESLVLTVTDNGQGFDLDTAMRREGHWGLRNVRERAQEIGAPCEIVSKPGHGTECRIVVPFFRVDAETR